MCHVLAFVGPRGGAGAGFVALNVASALARQGYWSVLLNADRRSGATQERAGSISVPGVHDRAWGYCRAEDVFETCGNGFDLVNLGGRAVWSGSDGLCRLLPLARELARRDFVLLDIPLEEIERCPRVLRTVGRLYAVVSEDQAAGFTAHRFLVNLHLFHGSRPIHVVLNRVRSRNLMDQMCTRLEHDFRKILGVDLRCSAWIPEDPREVEAAAVREPLVAYAPDAEASPQIYRLARRVVRVPGAPVDEHALHGFVKDLMWEDGLEIDRETVPFKGNTASFQSVQQSPVMP